MTAQSVQGDVPIFSSQCKMVPESATTFFIVESGAAPLIVRFADQEFAAVRLQ